MNKNISEFTLTEYHEKLSIECSNEIENILKKENNEYTIITLIKKYNKLWENFIDQEYEGVGKELWINFYIETFTSNLEKLKNSDIHSLLSMFPLEERTHVNINYYNEIIYDLLPKLKAMI